MHPYLSFLAVAVVGLLVPGPDTFVVLRTSLADGARAGTYAAAGSAAGNVLWGIASAVGVAGLLAASQTAFTALKLAGAVYLVYLGAQALRAARRGDPLVVEGPSLSGRAAFRRGLMSDFANVKVGLFWTALVPQFVTPGSGFALPLAMVATMAALVFAWLALYARLAGRLSRTLRRRSTARSLNGAVGALLVLLGARLGMAG